MVYLGYMLDNRARNMTAILLLICCFVAVAYGTISVAPKTTAVNVGNEATLTCTSTKATSWSFQAAGGTSTTTITSIDTAARVHIDNTGGKLNLVIGNAATADAGIYKCVDDDGSKGAYLAVYSPVPSNTAQVNSGQEYVNGDSVSTTCSAGFKANSQMTAHLDVSSGQSTTATAGTTASGSISLTGLTFNIQNNAVSSHTCKFYFTVTGNTDPELDTSNTATQTITPSGIQVSFCAQTPTVTPELPVYIPNEVLTCNSAGFPDPTYVWTDGSGNQIGTTKTITVPDQVGSTFTYTCTATNALTRLTCTPASKTFTFRVELTTTPPSKSTWNNLYLIPIILIPAILFCLLLAHALFRKKLELIRLGKTRVIEVLDAREYDAYVKAGQKPKEDPIRYDWRQAQP